MGRHVPCDLRLGHGRNTHKLQCDTIRPLGEIIQIINPRHFRGGGKFRPLISYNPPQSGNAEFHGHGLADGNLRVDFNRDAIFAEVQNVAFNRRALARQDADNDDKR